MCICWDIDTPLNDLNIDLIVPDWLDEDFSPYDMAGVYHGGCASGSYMPAVTYWQAKETMAHYGEKIWEYLQDHYVLDNNILNLDTSWGNLLCNIVSMAVELWVSENYDYVADWLLESTTKDEEE